MNELMKWVGKSHYHYYEEWNKRSEKEIAGRSAPAPTMLMNTPECANVVFSHEIAFLVFIFIHTTVTIYFDVQAASREQCYVQWNAKFQ